MMEFFYKIEYPRKSPRMMVVFEKMDIRFYKRTPYDSLKQKLFVYKYFTHYFLGVYIL